MKNLEMFISEANKLTLNEEKTEFMLIGSRSRLASVDNNPVLTLGDLRKVTWHDP
jgi:hypothetical protein